MVLETLHHDPRNAQRALASLALRVRHLTRVRVELPAHMQSRSAVVMPLDIPALQAEALTTAKLAPSGKQDHDRVQIRRRLIEGFDLF